MKFYTLENENASFEEFVKFWQQFYYNKNEDLYREHIKQDKLGSEDLERFSKFRNNTENLNQDKQAVFSEIKEKIELLNKFKQQEKLNLKKFRDEFVFVQPIWQFYLLHWCKPHLFPIFDEHPLKAQRFIQFQKIEELPYHDKTVEKFYFNHYIPDFYQKLPKGDLGNLEIYKALNAFGKFLNNLHIKK